jgi:hypothetical protein
LHIVWSDLKRLKEVNLDTNHKLLTTALHDFSIVVQEFFYVRGEEYLNNIDEKKLLIKMCESHENNYTYIYGIYHKLILHQQNQNEQAYVLEKWVRDRF